MRQLNRKGAAALRKYGVDWAATEREKANLIAGRPVDESKIDPLVLESWRRSLRAGVDPWETKYIMSGAGAASAYPDIFIEPGVIERDDGLLKLIYDYAAETGAVVEITDAKGKLVKVLAAPGTELVSVLYDAEHIFGTNAVSMALRLQRPVQLHGPEHFNIHVSNSDASSAPIRGSDGSIVGVLNFAGRRTRHGRDTLFAASLLSGVLEDYLIMSQYQGAVELCGSMLSEWMDALRAPDGVADGKGYRLSQDMLKNLNVRMERVLALERQRGALFRHTAGVRQLEQSVARAPGRSGSRVKHIVRTEGIFRLDDIIGNSDEIIQAKEFVEKTAASLAPVLLVGESGTGKELFAQSIHSVSARREGPFISINCGAIPNELVESEFFGYEAGSFTGGLRQGKSGKLLAASGGTLFLDEIESMPINVQVKLLRALSTGRITPIGGTKEIPVDIRVVSATKKRLEDECAAGRFREDLMFRINVLTLHLPPLRRRRGDIPLLVRTFIDAFSGGGGESRVRVEETAMLALRRYDWPGNVRQLKNVIERALILMGEKEEITLSDLPEQFRLHLSRTQLDQAQDMAAPSSGMMRRMEDLAVREVLQRENGNISRAARILGVSRSKLYRKYGVVLDEFKQKPGIKLKTVAKRYGNTGYVA